MTCLVFSFLLSDQSYSWKTQQCMPPTMRLWLCPEDFACVLLHFSYSMCLFVFKLQSLCKNTGESVHAGITNTKTQTHGQSLSSTIISVHQSRNHMQKLWAQSRLKTHIHTWSTAAPVVFGAVSEWWPVWEGHLSIAPPAGCLQPDVHISYCFSVCFTFGEANTYGKGIML